ncbi:MAG: hypothetical protein KJ626_11805 [Verrucomicrobia bacterium]|nr:hypothetical protein [Verrucomicrobiota bacterium]
MANEQEWDVKGRDVACAKCGTAFEDKQGIYSTLSSGEDGYARADYCDTCWSGLPRNDIISYWRTVFLLPPPPQAEAVRKENAESLLRKLIETEDHANLNTIYILAVMLERKRILAERDVQTREDGMKVRVYEHKETGETFMIPDPELKLAELEHIQEEVVVMLGGKPKEQAPEESEVPDDDDEFDEDEDEDEFDD